MFKGCRSIRQYALQHRKGLLYDWTPDWTLSRLSQFRTLLTLFIGPLFAHRFTFDQQAPPPPPPPLVLPYVAHCFIGKAKVCNLCSTSATNLTSKRPSPSPAASLHGASLARTRGAKLNMQSSDTSSSDLLTVYCYILSCRL